MRVDERIIVVYGKGTASSMNGGTIEGILLIYTHTLDGILEPFVEIFVVYVWIDRATMRMM